MKVKRNKLSKIVFFLIFTGLVASCGLRSDESDNENSDTVQQDEEKQVTEKKPVFQTKEHNFGEIYSGDEVGARFRFENKGDSPIIIERVSSGCGCTVAKYSQEPVKAGESGFVEVVFNSRGRRGAQFQDVRVYFEDMKKPFRLSIIAQVVKK